MSSQDANSDVTFRSARSDDLPAIVALLADDALGRTRNPLFDVDPHAYRSAFRAIADSPDNDIIVAEQAGRIVGCFQLTFIRGLSYAGGERAQIESVRVASDLRGQNLGTRMMQHAIALARQRGCVLVQLTTDARREHTRRFYERLGFSATHHGMKMRL